MALMTTCKPDEEELDEYYYFTKMPYSCLDSSIYRLKFLYPYFIPLPNQTKETNFFPIIRYQKRTNECLKNGKQIL